MVIRERIKERRLFEAQFLFGLLDEDDVSPQERLDLERELEGLLAVVRDLQLQANKYLAEGEPALARKMHREMERIAIDVPGLSSDRISGEPPPESPRETTLAEEREIPVKQEEQKENRRRPRTRRNTTSSLASQGQLWLSSLRARFARLSTGQLLLAACILVFLVAVVLFLNLMQRQYSDASLRSQAGEDIAIKPLSVRQGEASGMDGAPGDPPVQGRQPQGSAPPADTNISIGDLSVESGSKQ